MNAVLRIGFMLLLLSCCAQITSAQVGGPWWNSQWHYRLPVTAGANGFTRTDKVVNFPVNFTTVLSALGTAGPLNDQSVRVIEVDFGGNAIDTSTVYQFDHNPTYDPLTNASGTIVVLMAGTTNPASSRNFHVYFDTTAVGFALPSFSPQVTLTDNVLFQGQLSYQINYQLGILYYHKVGGGFAGMRDSNNVEWIGFDPTPGSHAGGEYRGIPNLGVAGHPGYTNGASTIVSQGPIKVTIQSQTVTPTAFTWTWDFYPTYATMTLTQAGQNYWLLYEGSPNGALDLVNGYVKNSSPQTLSQSSSFAADLPDPEWAYFGTTGQQRFMYLVHHEDDSVIDHYRPHSDNGFMTIFGFGRDGSSTTPLMSSVPTHLTFGFGEDESQAVSIMDNAFRDVLITIGDPAPLPVQLAAFTGSLVSSNRIHLEWRTASEINNYGFEVQKSLNNPNTFQTIPNSFVPGHGTTLEPHVYQFDDPVSGSGMWFYRLKQNDLDGSVHYSNSISINSVTGVKETSTPRSFALFQNYPNPFNPSTNIVFDLPNISRVRLEVLTPLGQVVRTLVNDTRPAGLYTVWFTSEDLATGTYFYRLTTNQGTLVRKMLLIR
ncbi:MAG: T9SS type A sorting domain-containing protein [bacterium]